MIPALTQRYAQKQTQQAELLNITDAPAAIALIDKVKDSGNLKQSYHLKSRNLDELEQDMANGFPLIGIKSSEGLLIGCATVSPHEDNNTVMMRSLCIDPAYVGNGLAKKLVETCLNWASENGTNQTIIAKVALDNTDSLTIFGKQGFSPIHTGTDPTDGYEYHLMAKKLDSPKKDCTRVYTQHPVGTLQFA